MQQQQQQPWQPHWQPQPAWGEPSAPGGGFPSSQPPPAQGGSQPGFQPAFMPSFVPQAPTQPPPPQQQQHQGWGAQSPPWPAPVLQDPMLNAGMQAGMKLVADQANIATQQFAPGVTSLWGSLKRKFSVNNTFVVRRLGLILFPYAQKKWEQGSGIPSQDINAPDLYIPTMALVTYVLATGLVKGAWMQFDPEVLVDAFGTSVTAQVFHVLAMRGFMWSLGPLAPVQVSYLDLLAYTGYQFVGVALNLLVGVALGSMSYTLCLVWTSMALGYLMFRTMQQVVPPPDLGQKGKKRRMYFLFGCVALQILVMFFLGYSKELRAVVKAESRTSWTVGSAFEDTNSGGSSHGAKVKPDSKAAKQAKAIPRSDEDEEEESSGTLPPTRKNKSNGGDSSNRGTKLKQDSKSGKAAQGDPT